MYAILADIHGNLCALQSVVEDMGGFDIDGVILLGDLIDYGMQSNEVVSYLQNDLKYPILCNIWGNHEHSIMMDDYSRFSSERGSNCARYIATTLTDNTISYLNTYMNKDGIEVLNILGKKILSVHGSLEDVYWTEIEPESVRGDYSSFDVVLSGHSHKAHVFTKTYLSKDALMRNKHLVMFINPGSVGQPRNHNPRAQYAILDIDTMTVELRAVEYDVGEAMSLYDGHVDDFYRTRLIRGI